MAGSGQFKVVVVTAWYPDDRHPSRTPFIKRHVEALREVGLNPTVVHLERGRSIQSLEVDDRGTAVLRLPVSVRHPLRTARSMHTLHRRIRTSSIVHTMAFPSLLLTAPAALTARSKWVHTEHFSGVAALARQGGLNAWLALLPLRVPAVVTAVSSQLGSLIDGARKHGTCPVTPNVVSARSVRRWPSGTTLRLVAVGNLNSIKDPLRAIQTVRELVRAGDDVLLTWVGDGPLRTEVEEELDDPELKNRVLLAGVCPPDEVSKYFEGAHLFFLPTRHETFLAAAAEAVSAGVPAVLPSGGGYEDFCTPDNSVLAASRQAADLASAIRTAAERFADVDPATVAATLAGRFEHASVGDEFAAIYARLRHGRSRRD